MGGAFPLGVDLGVNLIEHDDRATLSGCTPMT